MKSRLADGVVSKTTLFGPTPRNGPDLIELSQLD